MLCSQRCSREVAQLETSYQPRPAADIAASAARYLSARSSSSVIGTSPRRTCRASAVPSSTISAYADTWSGLQTSAESRDVCQSCIRSEEHTSELQSLMRIPYAVFCLKKKN